MVKVATSFQAKRFRKAFLSNSNIGHRTRYAKREKTNPRSYYFDKLYADTCTLSNLYTILSQY